MTAEIRSILTIIKKDIFKGNIPKKLRERTRSTSNGYQKAGILVRPRKY